MKKIFTYIMIPALMVMASACQSGKEKETPTGLLTGVYYAEIYEADGVMELLPGGSKSFDLRAVAKGENVSDAKLTISFKAADPEKVEAYNKEKGTSYVMCPGTAYEFTTNDVMMPRYGKSSTTARVKIGTSGLNDEDTYMLPITISGAVGEGKWEVADTLSAYVLFKKSKVDPSKGTGTAEMPYILSTVEDLKEMGSKLIEGTVVYFSLQNDIDMSGVEDWVPLNAFDPYNFKIDFNGNGHTISNFSCTSAQYPSFFGVLVGKCHDVSFTNATIDVNVASSCGILGGYCGTTGLPGEAYGVHVQGKVINAGSVNGVGGMFGRICEATINKCSADCVVSGAAYDVGGLYGYDAGVSQVRNCWTSGEVSGNRYVGGIAGMLYTPESGIYDCYSLSRVKAKFQYAGIVGNANLGQKADNATNDPKNHIERCIAWNDGLETTITDSDLHYSSGAIVGYTALKNYHVDCYRRADLYFVECPANSFNELYDQENSSPESPLVEAVEGKYNFPYHGKAAPAGATLSEVAKGLGWDQSIWVFSGNLPYFQGASVPVEDPDVNADGQLPDFDDSEFYK